MKKSLVLKSQAQRVLTRLQIHIWRQLDPMAVNLDWISPLIIIVCLDSSRLVENKSFIEIFQAAHLLSSGFGHTGNGDMEALLIIICILLGSKLRKAFICGILLIDLKIMPVSCRIISI